MSRLIQHLKKKTLFDVWLSDHDSLYLLYTMSALLTVISIVQAPNVWSPTGLHTHAAGNYEEYLEKTSEK